MIVGLSGYARVGKDTAAGALISERGFVRVAFADALKGDVRDMIETAIEYTCTGCDEIQHRMFSYDTQKELFRPLLVEYGRALRRLQPGHWILRAALDAEIHPLVVVTDVRYADEAEWIRGSGGIVIGIERAGYGPANDEERDSFSKFKADFTILNSGSQSDLRQRVLEVVDSWVKEQDKE